MAVRRAAVSIDPGPGIVSTCGHVVGSLGVGQGAGGGVALGVTYTDGTIGGSTKATIGDNVNIGQTDTVNSLTMTADSTVLADGDTVGVAGGIIAASMNFSFLTVNPKIHATIGNNTNINSLTRLS